MMGVQESIDELAIMMADLRADGRGEKATAIRNGIIALREKAQHWISVKDKLPIKDSLVLLYLTDGNQHKITTGKIYTSDDPKFDGEFCVGFDSLSPDFLIRDTVTHWMPLPNPPEK